MTYKVLTPDKTSYAKISSVCMLDLALSFLSKSQTSVATKKENINNKRRFPLLLIYFNYHKDHNNCGLL